MVDAHHSSEGSRPALGPFDLLQFSMLLGINKDRLVTKASIDKFGDHPTMTSYTQHSKHPNVETLRFQNEHPFRVGGLAPFPRTRQSRLAPTVLALQDHLGKLQVVLAYCTPEIP